MWPNNWEGWFFSVTCLGEKQQCGNKLKNHFSFGGCFLIIMQFHSLISHNFLNRDRFSTLKTPYFQIYTVAGRQDPANSFSQRGIRPEYFTSKFMSRNSVSSQVPVDTLFITCQNNLESTYTSCKVLEGILFWQICRIVNVYTVGTCRSSRRFHTTMSPATITQWKII